MMGLVNDRRASTDLELTSGGLVGAGFKVDSAWWNSLQSDNELKLKNVSQVFIYVLFTRFVMFSIVRRIKGIIKGQKS